MKKKTQKYKNPGFIYICISRLCEEKRKYGALYCEGVKTNPHILQENFYISIANSGMTLRLKFSDVLCKRVVYNKKCDEMMEKAKRKRNDIEKFETCNSILVGGLENKANFDLLL